MTTINNANDIAPAIREAIERRGYEILDVLGQGGVGIVLKVRHTRLSVVRAVKVLMHHGSGVRTRFEREAQIMARLALPEIVVIHDFWEDGHTGAMFIEMDFLSGGSLEQRLATLPPFATGMMVIADVLRTLAKIHAVSVVHRDIKPANIMFADAGWKPVLVDFGIVATSGGDNAKMTQQGVAMGTPAFMAPEQNRDAGSVSVTADIHAVGVTLMCLAGFTPTVFVGQTLRDNPENIKAIARLPDVIRDVVNKATAVDPDDRYQSASEMLADVKVAMREIETPQGATIIPSNVNESAAAPPPVVKLVGEKGNAPPLVFGDVHDASVGDTYDDPPVVKMSRMRALVAVMAIIAVLAIVCTGIGGSTWIFTHSRTNDTSSDTGVKMVTEPKPAETPAKVRLPIPTPTTPTPTRTLTPTPKPTPTPTQAMAEPKPEKAKAQPTPTRTPAIAATGKVTIHGEFHRARLEKSGQIVTLPSSSITPGEYQLSVEFIDGGGYDNIKTVVVKAGNEISISCADYNCQ